MYIYIADSLVCAPFNFIIKESKSKINDATRYCPLNFKTTEAKMNIHSFQLFKRSTTIFIIILSSALSNLSLSQNQPKSPLIESYKEHTALKAETPYGLEWIQLGPTLNGARVEAIQADPDKPGVIYAAFGSGGLWKSINNGLKWKPIFENMPSLGIGDIALAPSNPEIIYVATGESLKKARNFTMPGTGVYRSDNGGDTWVHLGLNDTWHIGEIVVHPTNPDIVLVAAQGHFWSPNENRGIFRTSDGGKSWHHALFIDEQTGANDIVFSPANPDIVYASTWENYPNVSGKKSAVYKSEDGGLSWFKITNGVLINENTGRIGIAASYQDKDKAYMFVDQRNQARGNGSGEIYKTVDGGKNWVKTHDENIKSLSVIGWYFMDLYVNPQNDEEIYGLGVQLSHSTDGGKTFKHINGKITHLTPSPAQTLHLDQCEMWINPKNPKELLLGNDGGVYHSYDNGASWLHLNNIPAGEFYDIEIDQQKKYNIYGGTQDDATVFGLAQEWNPEIDDPWKYLWIDAWSGGDGCITLVDPNDENTVYFSMQNGGAQRMDLSLGKSVSIRPRFPKKDNINIKYNFITPYMLSPHNSNRVFMAGNYVMQSDDRGDHWTVISPNLIDKGNHSKKETAAGAMAASSIEEGTLYMGTDRGSMWLTNNGGKNWKNISQGLSDQYIRSIYPSKHKKERVYVQMTGLNYDEFGAYLYVSEDYGAHWKPIINNLPNHPVNSIVEDPDFENILYAGTYRGVYVSIDRGENWCYFGAGLPDTSIADIVIEKRSKDMIIATHGRGIYKVNLKPFYHQIALKEVSSYLYDIGTIKRPSLRDTHKDVDEKSVQKLPITFSLNKPETIHLKITNASDSLIWKKTIVGRKGLNQYRWNLVIKEESSNLPYYIHFKKYLEKGAYNLILESAEGTFKKRLSVIDAD